MIYSTDVYQEGSIEAFLYDLYEFVATGGFVLLVAGSAIMLRHYATSIGRVKFWMIVLLPLAYFLSSLVDTLGIYVPESDGELFWSCLMPP